MLEIIIKSLCIVLLIYAVITIISKFVETSKKPSKIYFAVIKIDETTDNIEMLLRSIIWKSLSISGGGFVPNILVVDGGANEEVINIVFKLAKEYEFIYYIKEDEYNEFRSKFMM